MDTKVRNFLRKNSALKEAMEDNQDVYAKLASYMFNVPYSECLEFTADGEFQPEGKKRRFAAKTAAVMLCCDWAPNMEVAE